MKNIAYAFGLSVIVLLLLLIITTISGRMMRETEIRETLASAVDNAVENAMETNTYEINDRKQFISDVMENLAIQYHSKSETVKISINGADKTKGMLGLTATAYYKNPIGNTGSVEYSKQCIYSAKTVDENYAINYMLDDETRYRTYSARAKDTYPVPDDPAVTGKVFTGWRNAEGTRFTKGKNFPATVTGSATYYAEFSTESVPAVSLTIEAESDVMNTGDKQFVTAKVMPENATNAAVKWSSSDPAVLSVDSMGLVTAQKTGEADITAELADGSLPPAMVRIRVTEVENFSVKADATFINENGSSRKIMVTTDSGRTINADCSFVSSNNSVVTVNSTGVITNEGPGTAYITVTHRRSGVKFKIPVISAEVKDCHCTYDGNPHGITISCPGADISYAEEAAEGTDGISYKKENPQYIKAGSYTVLYKISFDSCTPAEGSAEVVIEKAQRSLSISAASDTLVYPEEKTYTFTSDEEDDSKIMLNTEDNDGCLAASRDGNTIRLMSGTKEGDVKVNISLPETENYRMTEKTLLVHVKNGAMKADITVPEGGVYDGENHTINVRPQEPCEDAVVTYSSTKDGEYSTEAPECTDAGTHTVFYRVELAGYKTLEGSEKVVIKKAPGKLSFSKGEVTLTEDGECQISVSQNLSDGKISLESAGNGLVSVKKETVTVHTDEQTDDETGEVILPASDSSVFAGYSIKAQGKDGYTAVRFRSAASSNYTEAECIIPVYVGPACGVFDKDGNPELSWDDLVNVLGADISKDYTVDSYRTDEDSLYSAVKRAKTGESTLSSYVDTSRLTFAKIVVPAIHQRIGNYAFAGLDSVTDITILSGVGEIGTYAFAGCPSLVHVTVPDSVKDIGDSAFAGVRTVCYDGTAQGNPWGAGQIHEYAPESTECSRCGKKKSGSRLPATEISDVKAEQKQQEPGTEMPDTENTEE